MEFQPISIAQSVVPVTNIFSATSNDLALSEDEAVPHSLVSNALVISSDLVASTIFSDSISLMASREQQSRSVNAIPIVHRSFVVVPISNLLVVHDFFMDIGSDLSLDLSVGQASSFSRLETIL